MPDTTLPRPIEPGEIRVGDRVRLTWDEPGSVHTHEFTVTFTDDIDGLRSIGYKPDTGYTTEYVGTWELLSRPTPAPAVGERFSTTDGSCWFAFTGDQGVLRAFCYVSGTRFTADKGTVDVAWLAHKWAPLTPIPDHGDGCSEWPRGADGEPRCDEQMDNLTCSRERDHDGFHAAYGSVGDAHPYLVWAGGERVASWSERRQANG